MTCGWLASRPGEVEILLAASCYRNRDKPQQLWVSLGSKASHTLTVAETGGGGGWSSFWRLKDTRCKGRMTNALLSFHQPSVDQSNITNKQILLDPSFRPWAQLSTILLSSLQTSCHLYKTVMVSLSLTLPSLLRKSPTLTSRMIRWCYPSMH